MEERDLLQHLRSAADGSAARLVYADWLEAHGDEIRAELIRLEEHRRRLAVLDDAYWETKPRLAALRRGVSRDWLAAVGLDTLYQPTLSGWPGASTSQRLLLLRELVERWTGEVVCLGLHDIEAVQSRLERTLPSPALEWHRFASDLVASPRTAAPLRDGYGPHTMTPLAGVPGALALLVQAEGDVAWYVDQNDESPESRVHTALLEDKAWVSAWDAGVLSAFALTYVLSYLRGSAQYSIQVDSWSDVDARLSTWFTGSTAVADNTPFNEGRTWVAERPGALAIVNESSEALRFSLLVQHPIPLDEVPPPLQPPWGRGGTFGGKLSE
jgi:uncharacterized protein (TIGR02996 family)